LDWLVRQFPEVPRDELEQALRGDHLRLQPQAQPTAQDRVARTEATGTRKRGGPRSSSPGVRSKRTPGQRFVAV